MAREGANAVGEFRKRGCSGVGVEGDIREGTQGAYHKDAEAG